MKSRWIEVPEHVTEVGAGLPAGFRASGVACGLKPSGAPDLGLLVSDAPETVSAARFTRSGVLAAPVIPQLNDRDLEAILEAAAHHGARHAGWIMLRLPLEVAPLFRDWHPAGSAQPG